MVKVLYYEGFISIRIDLPAHLNYPKYLYFPHFPLEPASINLLLLGKNKNLMYLLKNLWEIFTNPQEGIIHLFFFK